MMQISVRSETPSDYHVIYDITARAFAPMPFAAGDEQVLINNLRDAGALAISRVAEVNGHVRGHVAFSSAQAADGSTPWFALGPIAVDPAFQRRGIGKALILNGIQALRDRGALGCILVGDSKYYQRFGFVPEPELCPSPYPPEYFMIMPLRIAKPSTVVDFHPLFTSSGVA
jgi:putative acetyltransferase